MLGGVNVGGVRRTQTVSDIVKIRLGNAKRSNHYRGVTRTAAKGKVNPVLDDAYDFIETLGVV